MTTNLIPRHDVTSVSKMSEIAQSMERDGWQGAPLVHIDDIQVTGVHRRAAWELIGRSVQEIPTIDLLEICPDLSSEWETLCQDFDWQVALEELLKLVPVEIADQYGIEV